MGNVVNLFKSCLSKDNICVLCLEEIDKYTIKKLHNCKCNLIYHHKCFQEYIRTNMHIYQCTDCKKRVCSHDNCIMCSQKSHNYEIIDTCRHKSFVICLPCKNTRKMLFADCAKCDRVHKHKNKNKKIEK